jgi:hypothetical protein
MSYRTPEADVFAGVRMPDLPNDGYSTPREKQLSDAVMMFIRDAERDRLLLLDIVCRGEAEFVKISRKAWRHLRIDEGLCKAVYGYLTLLAGAEPEQQRQHLLTYKWSPFVGD